MILTVYINKSIHKINVITFIIVVIELLIQGVSTMQHIITYIYISFSNMVKQQVGGQILWCIKLNSVINYTFNACKKR